MPTRRMIDPAFWQSETLARLTIQQRYLFIGLFSNADDQGRLRGNPALIRSLVFPYEDMTISQLEADIAAIAEIESIILYECKGNHYIQIRGWWDYQSPQWAYPSKLPPPAGWNDRLRYRYNNQVVTKNWGDKPDTPNGLPEQPNETENEEIESLPKALAKPLGNGLAGPIVQPSIALDSDSESTPNGVGEKSPETPPDKKPKTQPEPKPDGPKKQLMGTFQTETHMNLPGRRPTNSLWWAKIGEIEEIAGGDVELGKRLIVQAVKALKDKQLTIGGPESIIKTCRALAAGQAIGGNNNGHETHYKKPTIDAEAYRHLEAQNAANTGAAGRAGPPASRDRPAE